MLETRLPAWVLGVVYGAFALGVLANGVTHSNAPISITAAWCTLLASAWFVPWVRRKHGACASLAVLVSLGCSAFGLACIALAKLTHPFVVRHYDRPGEGAVFIVLAVLGSPALASVFGLQFAERAFAATTPRAARPLRSLAWCALLAAAGLATAASRRAASMPPSDMLVFPEGAEVMRLCAVDETCDTRRPARAMFSGSHRAGVYTIDESSRDGVRVTRACNAERMCWLRLTRDADARGPGEPVADWSPAHLGTGTAVVRHASREGYWLIDVSGAPISNELQPFAASQRHAFDAQLRPTELSLGDFAASLSAPRGWRYGAIAGVLLALAVLVAPERRRANRTPDAFDEGTHDGSGTLRSLDGSVAGVMSASPATLGAGPVHWERVAREPGAPFRERVTIDGVRAGTLADLRFAHAAPALARSLFALTALALTSAPLFAAALAGLVF